ncbi:MAG: ComF family protein [Pseudomonadota bacterium]
MLNTLVEVVYPPHCLSCGGTVEAGGGLCSTCWPDATFLAGTRCDLCSVPLPGEVHAEDGPLICDACLTTPRPWSKGRSALAYSGAGRRMVLSLKHADRTDLPDAAARWMANAARDIFVPDMLVAPVPLHWIRLFRRRYNQAALLSAAVARMTSLEHCPDLLKRLRATPTQEGRGRDARFANMTAAIALNDARRARVQGRSVLLVDDVLTSGATLAACAEVCRAAGASDVRVLTLARVVPEA